MAVKLTCTDNASGHDGLRWRMGPDAQSVSIVVGETAPGAGELVVSSPITPEACFSVVAYSGSEEGTAAAVCADTGPEDFSAAAIGDEIGGGIYAGINTESDGTEYHIIFALQEGELAPSAESRWKVERTSTPGTDSSTDGWANTQAMEAAGLTDHPAALHCRTYEDADGNDDYYLPARSELALEVELREHPELSSSRSTHRWTSTQSDQFQAWSRTFDGTESGSTFGNNKDSTSRRVRPVRRVPV